MIREEYKGVTIEYQEEHAGGGHQDHPILIVNGKNVHVMRISHELYSSHHLPYYTFSNLADLGKALVDGVPLFQEKRDRK